MVITSYFLRKKTTKKGASDEEDFKNWQRCQNETGEGEGDL
jgi:hypothetical protein